MANKTLFANKTATKLTKNDAGGWAYALTPKQTLAQIAATNCFNGTYYADANKNLELAKEAVLNLSNDPEFLAKVAVYSREKSYMKDMPAFILVALAEVDTDLFHKVFDRVVDNAKMLRNVVQMARSGVVTGRTRNMSAGAYRRAIQRWFNARSPEDVFRASIGNDPSMADVIKMARPKPKTKGMSAVFAYLLGKDTDRRYLPAIVKEYEAFKKSPQAYEVPRLDFRMLDSFMTADQRRGLWITQADRMGWQATRMNLNNFQKYGVFDNPELVTTVANRLKNGKLIADAKVFPYQLLTAYLNTDTVPAKVRNALQDAMEVATENVPDFGGKTLVAVDTSGSMSAPITGHRYGATTNTTCVQVAGLIASCVLRKNEDSEVLPFDTRVHRANLNSRDTVMTNAKTLARFGGGGTSCSVALADWNSRKVKADLVIYVSDCESWCDGYYGWGNHNKTALMAEWKKFKGRNPRAKLVLIDLTPGNTSQANDEKDVLKVGGWSDEVFNVIAAFVKDGGKDHWVKEIQAIRLD